MNTKTQLTQEQKMEIYNYRKDLILNDRGYGGSIMKRCRERFNMAGDEIVEIYKEIEQIEKAKTN